MNIFRGVDWAVQLLSKWINLTKLISWSLFNIAFGLSQLIILMVIYFFLAQTIDWEKILSNCVLLFFSCSLMGNTVYWLYKTGRFEQKRHLALTTIILSAILAVVTIVLYTIIHFYDAGIMKQGLPDERSLLAQVLITGLVVMFCYHES